MKQLVIKIFTIFLIIFFGLSAKAQNIAGQVLQTDNQKSIPFASLAIKGTTLGTVTDFEGNFYLEIPQKHLQGKLQVSCVGYKASEYDIINISGNNNLQFELESVNIEIDEVVVEKKSLFPYTILKKAINFIPDNYITKPYNYELYYQSKNVLRTNEIRQREAVVLMSDKTGYIKESIYKTFKNINYIFMNTRRNFDVYSINEGNTNIDDMLEFDIARHKGNVLDINRLYDFDIAIKDEIVYKDDSVWVISYTSKNPGLLTTGNMHDYFYTGEIMIKKEDYAILYNKTSVKSKNYSGLSRNLFVSYANEDSQLDNVFYKFEVFYKKQSGVYVTDKINFNVNYNYKEPLPNQIINNETVLEVLRFITEKPHMIDSRDYYEDNKADLSFWRNFKP